MVKSIPSNYEAARALLAEGFWQVDLELGLVVGPAGKPYKVADPNRYITLGIPTYRTDLPQGRVMAHRVIWESVNGPLPEDLVINHLDGNKQHNRLSNLEVVTQAENMGHAFRTGLKVAKSGADHPNTDLSATQVKEIYARANGGELGTSLAAEYGVTKATVSRIKLGLSWASVTGHQAA